MSEFDSEGAMLDKVYSQKELLSYLNYAQEKAQTFLRSASLETLQSTFDHPKRNYSRLEITIYKMRHIQHHAAQLNLILRKETGDATSWVPRA